MTRSPSAGDVAKLVEELQAHMGRAEVPDLLRDCRRAATALESLSRDLAEAREELRILSDDYRTLGDRVAATSRDLADARAALEPFVRAFDTAREKHGRRYGKDAAVGLKNFDKMPDRWPMDHLTFDMGTFRRARSVLPQKEAE